MVRHISLGNGSLLVNIDGELRLRDLYFPYAGQENHVLGDPHRIGVHAEGFSWLDEWDTRPRYEKDSILGDSTAFNEIEDLELKFRDAVQCDENVFLREIQVVNHRDSDREIELFFKQVFNLKGTGMADTCFYHPEHSGVIHYKKNRYVMAEVKKESGECGDLNQYGIYRDGAEEDIESKQLNSNPIAQGDIESAISINIELEASESKKIYYWINTAENLEDLMELNEKVDEQTSDFLHNTDMCWKGFVGNIESRVEGLSQERINSLKRSVLVVRGQINNNGAITAANDSDNLEYNQDKYGYVWPRDAALVVESMAEAGYHELVRPYFDFAEDVISPEGYFLHKFNPDGSLGSSWHSWVNDEGGKRLPIQEDETALTIWALKRYSEKSGDKEILRKKWRSIVKPAADFLTSYFDTELHLPHPSYDLWEENYYVSTFTVASVYAGLKAASEIAEEIGEDGELYRKRANQIKNRGLSNLISEDSRRYVRGLEEGEQLDEVSAPMMFLEKFGLVDKDDEYFQNTVNAIIYDLSPDTEVGGIARYSEDYYHNVTEDFETVPGNPWIICTLWVAQYYIRNAETSEDLKEAEKYIEWVEEHALETGVLPEQVHPFTGEGLSVSPLTWSHTTFIETLISYGKKKKEVQA